MACIPTFTFCTKVITLRCAPSRENLTNPSLATWTTRARRYYLTPDLSHISAAGASPDAARLDPLLDRGNNDRTMDAHPRGAGENLVASRGDSTLVLTPDPDARIPRSNVKAGLIIPKNISRQKLIKVNNFGKIHKRVLVQKIWLSDFLMKQKFPPIGIKIIIKIKIKIITVNLDL